MNEPKKLILLIFKYGGSSKIWKKFKQQFRLS